MWKVAASYFIRRQIHGTYPPTVQFRSVIEMIIIIFIWTEKWSQTFSQKLSLTCLTRQWDLTLSTRLWLLFPINWALAGCLLNSKYLFRLALFPTSQSLSYELVISYIFRKQTDLQVKCFLNKQICKLNAF